MQFMSFTTWVIAILTHENSEDTKLEKQYTRYWAILEYNYFCKKGEHYMSEYLSCLVNAEMPAKEHIYERGSICEE